MHQRISPYFLLSQVNIPFRVRLLVYLQHLRQMMTLAARHDIRTVTEHFLLSCVNEAFERLESGRVRYRLVLDNDVDTSPA